MIPKASSLPARNRATSCSSERSRKSRTGCHVGRRSAAGALRAEASTERPVLGDPNYPRGRKLREWLSATAASTNVGHDVLDHGVVLEGVHREVLAVAGLLEAAVRHLGDQRDVVVDPHAAEAQGGADAQGPADVAGPDRAGQAVGRPVGPRDGLVLVAERLDGDDRAEDLALDHLVVLLEAGDHGRLEVEAGQVGLAAAGHDLRVAGLALEEALDALALAGAVERPEGRVGAEGVAHDEALGLLGEPADDVVVDLLAGEHAGG